MQNKSPSAFASGDCFDHLFLSTCKASPNVRATVVIIIITIIIAGEELLGLHRGDIIAQLGKPGRVLIGDVEMAMREGLREIGLRQISLWLLEGQMQSTCISLPA